MRRVLALTVLLSLALPASAGAALRLGVVGDKSRFQNLTTQHTDINLVFTSWNTGVDHPGILDRKLSEHGPIPMLGWGTTNTDGRQVIRPRGIARGDGDKFLVAVNQAAARWGQEIYVRPLAEMNAYWNKYSAFNANGTSRGPSYSTRAYRKAFRRMYIILHGGTRDEVNAKLAALGQSNLHGSADPTANPLLHVVWNPQGYGAPNLARNSANSYYPGDAYVDLVGNDLYDQHFTAAWDANLALYQSHPSKPYVIGEWGLWGIDDPAFVRRMASFARNHKRVEALIYYRSDKGSVFDLATKPKSRAAYKQYIVPLG